MAKFADEAAKNAKDASSNLVIDIFALFALFADSIS